MSHSTNRRRNTSVGLILAGAALAALAFITPANAGGPVDSTYGGTTINVDNTPYSYDDGTCDEMGWHIILNQIEPDGLTAADFGNVILEFADGSTGTATFNKITPGGVASWYYMPAPGTEPQTVVSASMTFPEGSGVTSYGRFNISNPACYAPLPTTSTQPPTTVPTTQPVITVPVPAPAPAPYLVPARPSYTG
jgi:hypothetical protein